jgi:osmoprotectant transport system substrate-binding protein
MRTKGLWARILGLLVVLAFLASCGSAGSGTTASSTADSASTAASAAGSAAASGADAGASAAGSAAGGATIKVGSKNFTEAVLLGEMYAQLLEANGFTVERKLNLGATDIAQQALINGEIDLYPEYTSTGLLEVLKKPKETDPAKILSTLRTDYEQQFKLTWLEPAKFNDTNTFAMTKARAQELGITTYSDLFKQAGNLVLGGPPEFLGREDTKQLQETYGGFEFKDTKQLDPGLRYQALQDGQIDVVVAFSTDGQIGGFDLQALEDDKSFYPIYQAAPVVRQDTLQANPKIADALNVIGDKLDETTMAKLNWQVDGPDKKDPPDVVKQFLTEQGLVK